MPLQQSFGGCQTTGGSAATAGSLGGGASARGIFARILDGLWAWQQRANARRALAKLDDRMLRDIGLDRATADAEASKPFWRA